MQAQTKWPKEERRTLAKGEWAWVRFFCDVHKLATTQTSVLPLVNETITGVLHVSLAKTDGLHIGPELLYGHTARPRSKYETEYHRERPVIGNASHVHVS